MDIKIKRLARELAYKGKILDIYKDTIQLPNGKIDYWDHIGHRTGAAAVLPVLPDGKILLVHQFRNSLDRLTWELPAGGRDSVDEDYMLCAARELEEETGYRSSKLTKLLELRTTVAFCNELIHIFLAEDLEPGNKHLDEGEDIEVKAFDLEELMQMISEGVLQDSKTVSAILAYKCMLCK